MTSIQISNTMELVCLADEINREHELCLQGQENAVEHAARCGMLLIQQKGSLDYGGEWLGWVKENCAFSTRTANNYIKIASKLNNLQRAANHSNLKSAKSQRAALRIIAAEEPKPQKPPEPEPLPPVFSWAKDETYLKALDGLDAVKSAVALMLNPKQDPITATHLVRMMAKSMAEMAAHIYGKVGAG